MNFLLNIWIRIHFFLKLITAILKELHIFSQYLHVCSSCSSYLHVETIIKESNVIEKHPSIHRVPPFEMVMSQFLNLLAQIRTKKFNIYSTFLLVVLREDAISWAIFKQDATHFGFADWNDWLVDASSQRNWNDVFTFVGHPSTNGW